ncbi:MAG TPA: tetratricopeptide repeat protein [Planctomycetota bacterium]|nr:tetratricopeptide repeat protein [Planctomycetota bacterium]
MKLLNRLRIWKELRHLEAKVREEPSPSTFVDLGQVYINLGMLNETLAAADEGLRLFPNSAELRKLLKFAKRKQLDGRIKELRQRLNKNATAKLYRDLAQLYVELGDFGSVQGTCEECIRRFPQDPGAHLILARTRLTNFYRDMTPRDGLEAVRGLQRVIELDPANATAHRLLAEVLYRTGAVRSALVHLERLHQLEPQDNSVALALDNLRRQPIPAHDDLEVLFHAVEAAGRLPYGPLVHESGRGGADEGSVGHIREALAHIAEVRGVHKAAYIRGAKALVKGDIKDGRDAFLRVVRVVAKAAQRAARRMDIGNFSKGVMDGEFGHICVCCFGDVIAAVLCAAGTPTDQILTDLQELVASSLCERD